MYKFTYFKLYKIFKSAVTYGSETWIWGDSYKTHTLTHTKGRTSSGRDVK